MTLETLRGKLAYPPLLLGIVTLLASAALTWAADATHTAIAEAEARDLRDSLIEVLPAGFADNDLQNDTIELDRAGVPLTVYRARAGGLVKGAVFRVAERGYAADIQILMAVDRDGRLLGVRVIKHSETPGLGDKIEVKKDGWIKSFDGKTMGAPVASQWAVKKDGGVFDQFAGATITPRAVVKAVKGGLEFFAVHRDGILGE